MKEYWPFPIILDLRGILVFSDDHLLNLWDFQETLDPHGISVFWEDHFSNLWDVQVTLEPRDISVFLEDQVFESLGFPRNSGSAWNRGIFRRSNLGIFEISKKPQTSSRIVIAYPS